MSHIVDHTLCPLCRSAVRMGSTDLDGDFFRCTKCGFQWAPCEEGCKGWDVVDNDRDGLGIERCDMCFAEHAGLVTDAMFAAWPEAKRALAAALMKTYAKTARDGFKQAFLLSTRIANTLGHIVTSCNRSVECFRCGASGFVADQQLNGPVFNTNCERG